MKKRHVLLVAGVASVRVLGGGGAAAWWYLKPKAAHAEEAPKVDKTVYKYVNLDKVLVMLRGREGEPLSHYLAVDMVFKTPAEQERCSRTTCRCCAAWRSRRCRPTRWRRPAR